MARHAYRRGSMLDEVAATAKFVVIYTLEGRRGMAFFGSTGEGGTGVLGGDNRVSRLREFVRNLRASGAQVTIWKPARLKP